MTDSAINEGEYLINFKANAKYYNKELSIIERTFLLEV